MRGPILELDKMVIDILENFLDNIMVYNSEGTLLYACDKFWMDTGLDPDKDKTIGISEIKKLKIYEPYSAEIAFKSGEKATVVQKAFENEITVATAIPIRNKDGVIRLIVSYAEDNQQIIELEDKLEQANRMIKEKNIEISELLVREIHESDLLGSSSEVLKVQKLIERIVHFDANVLLTGETGVGKTMYAKRIHFGGKRSNLPFIEINCAAIPETLLESELFGYEAGAFTGAHEKGKKGHIEMAAGGTLFLDEISELSMNLQSKLLKVIQDKKITRIGSTMPIDVDFRLIVATNVDLEVSVEQGQFRPDLYYRLNVIPINIPALRQRREDIHPLAKHFLDTFNLKYNATKYFSKEAVDLLTGYDWPGNVRELENTIERLILTVEKSEITARDISDTLNQELIATIGSNNGIQEVIDNLEKELIQKAYREFDGNVSRMAAKLKLTRQSLLRRMAKYDILKSNRA